MPQRSSTSEPAESRTGFLDTFVAPRPNSFLIRALVPVNRVLCLGGVPGLRDVPGLRHVPGLRGLVDIVKFDLPRDDLDRLRAAVTPETATFLTPNHPEFFTDWMIDKEILARVAPIAACWATNTIVNGMGPLMQRFWLKNNLIAQIPGARGGGARTFSVDWAQQGHGVLLHPEGTVGWHGDRVGPLFTGAVEMAAEAAEKLRAEGRAARALVAPVVWKLVFRRDVGPELAREMRYVESKLGLEGGAGQRTIAERVIDAYCQLLVRDEQALDVAGDNNASYALRQERLLAVLDQKLRGYLREAVRNDAPAPEATAFEQVSGAMRAADRWVRSTPEADPELVGKLRKLGRVARRLMRFRCDFYPGGRMTQEHVAENIKRLRSDYCTGTWRDTVACLVPRPVGPRMAHVRVPEPIDLSAESLPLSKDRARALTDELGRRMQRALDEINRSLEDQIADRSYANPLCDRA